MRIKITQRLPKDVLRIVKAVGKTGDDLNLRVYLVGGPVRDILLKRKACDTDFVVEGDAVEFAGYLNKRLKGKLIKYPAFRTATVHLRNCGVDLVTARKETYKRPGAYPDVEPASIKEDLFRRDFTVNAMALSLNRDAFGELADFYGGRRDIKNGLVRVLHDRSFVDDPTRIFRAVRFSVRFNFAIERHTKKLIKETISEGYLADVNRGRIKKEIELFFKEQKPLECLDRFSKLA